MLRILKLRVLNNFPTNANLKRSTFDRYSSDFKLTKLVDRATVIDTVSGTAKMSERWFELRPARCRYQLIS